MSKHVEFYEFLGQCNEGSSLQAAYREYKLANGGSTFLMNDGLKRGALHDVELRKLSDNLEKIICAENTSPMVVYRMTSDIEFGLLDVARDGAPFSYPAFMSTSGRDSNLHSFVPSEGSPLLLEIHCPSGIKMALLEEDGGMEDEFLLGRDTTFEIEDYSELVDQDALSTYLGIGHGKDSLLQLVIRVVENPPYTTELEVFPFEKEDGGPEVEYL